MKALLFGVWLGSFLAGVRAQADGGFWWLTPQPKAPVTPPTIYCECVPYYLCENGTILTSGAGLLDIRTGVTNQPTTNVENCPNLIDICCGLPDGFETSAGPPTQPPTPPQPLTQDCVCVEQELCRDGNIITDGAGLINIRVRNPNLQACTGSQVCCKPPAPLTPPPPTPTQDCVCVVPELCQNGFVNTDGAGLIDVRFGNSNPQTCSSSEVCCSLPPAPTQLTTTTQRPTLPPDTPCECVSFINCTEERLVSDLAGNTFLDINGLGPFSHSKCPQSLAVCCALEPTLPTHPTTPTQPSNSTSGGSGQTEECVCVEPVQCRADGYINTDGAGIINIRTLVKGPTCPSTQVCCKLVPDSTTTGPTTTTTTTTSAAPGPIVCGNRNIFGVKARILGFREGESQFGEFPWVTAILVNENMMGKIIKKFVGGGSLIHPRVVITAAHKVLGKDINTMVVRAGEWDTQEELEPYPYQDISVQEVIIHPQFNPTLLYNDIALVILKEEANINQPHINTICLEQDFNNINTTACIINGWGLNGFEQDAEYQKVMKSLTIPLVLHQECVYSLRRTRLGQFFRLHNSFICAGGEKGKDACKGDGGGPLACPRLDNPTRYHLVGITAWGIGCGEEGIPGVYANVPLHYDWIFSEIYSRYPKTTTSADFTTNGNGTTSSGTSVAGTVSTISTSGGGSQQTTVNGEPIETVNRNPNRQERREQRQEERRRNRQDAREERRGNKEERRREREERRRERQMRREG